MGLAKISGVQHASLGRAEGRRRGHRLAEWRRYMPAFLTEVPFDARKEYSWLADLRVHAHHGRPPRIKTACPGGN